MRYGRFWLCVFLCVASMATAHAQATPSGLTLPRFAQLKGNEVNLRTGPGIRYPIDWVYHTKGMPIEVIAEYDTWRQIRDKDGTEGWVHLSMLSGTRAGIVTRDRVTLYKNPDHTRPAAVLRRDVIVTLDKCLASQCRGQVKGFRGWIDRRALWGLYPDETFD